MAAFAAKLNSGLQRRQGGLDCRRVYGATFLDQHAATVMMHSASEMRRRSLRSQNFGDSGSLRSEAAWQTTRDQSVSPQMLARWSSCGPFGVQEAREGPGGD